MSLKGATAAVLAIALVGCAEPTVIQNVDIDVNHAHPYQHYAKRDYRELAEGESGNCAALAYALLALGADQLPCSSGCQLGSSRWNLL